jgi:hypothetical protein
MVNVNTPNIPTVDIDTGELSNGKTVSHGTAAIFEKLYKLSSDRKRPTFEYFLINIATLIRNIISSFKTVEPRLVFRYLQLEIEMYNLYISQYSIPDTNNSLVINTVFYYPSYANIHEQYIKKPTKSEKQVNDLLKALYKYQSTTRELYDNIYTNVVTVGKHKLPHIELNHHLNTLDMNANYKRFCMVSHVPLDYHFSSYSPKFWLLRSHTGDIVTRDVFGEIVFKYKVPFNKYTHLIYGDGKYIRSVLSTEQKRKLESIALRDKWKYKTESSIMTYIIKSGLVPYGYYKNSPI